MRITATNEAGHNLVKLCTRIALALNEGDTGKNPIFGTLSDCTATF
jgi:hypothetical protein